MLESLIMGWYFMEIYANGRLGGLEINCNKKPIKILGSWGLEGPLVVGIFMLDMGRDMNIVIIYGPYKEGNSF